jgi:excinuclease ABC subunit C
MVVFENGVPATSEYRRFRIKTVEGQDDFASMREVLGRRFKTIARRRREEREAQALADQPGHDGTPSELPVLPNGDGAQRSDGDLLPMVAESPGVYSLTAQGQPIGEVPALPDASEDGAVPAELPDDASPWDAVPDLVIIDGGKGQLGAVLDVMRDLDLPDVPVCGLAKQHEEIFVKDVSEPIVLPRDSEALYLVQRIRDEAHRFAITYHRQLRGKKATQSVLDTIPGIGPKRKRALLRKFGSVKGIREATVEEVASTVGFTSRLAETVKRSL